MEISQQILLATREACVDVAFEHCELFILHCTLSQMLQLVGKATLTVILIRTWVVIILTAMIRSLMLSSGSMGVT